MPQIASKQWVFDVKHVMRYDEAQETFVARDDWCIIVGPYGSTNQSAFCPLAVPPNGTCYFLTEEQAIEYAELLAEVLKKNGH